MAYTTVNGLNGTIKAAIEELQANLPDPASGDELKFARVKNDLSGLEYVTGGGGATAFTGLSDVPASYTSQALKVVRVNAGETGLEFATASGTGTVTSVGLTVGTAGTDIAVSGSPVTTSGSFTLDIPTASASNRGALSSSDWTTFNNKQSTGLSWLLASGGTLTADNTIGGSFGIGFGAAPATNNKILIKGLGTGTGETLKLQNSSNTETYKILDNGIHVFGSSLSTPWIFNFSTVAPTPDLAGRNLSFYSFTTTQSAISGRFAYTGEQHTQTSGDQIHLYVVDQFAPTSGTATATALQVEPQINQSVGGTGITRGIYVRPTLTSPADYRTFEFNNNSGWGLYGVGTATNYLAGSLSIGTTSTSSKLYVKGTGTTTGNLALFEDSTATAKLTLLDNGNLTTTGDITIADAKNIILNTTTGTKIGTATTQKLGFFNATPVVQPSAYTASNVTTDRSYDANATTLDEVADVLGTLISDLKALGLIG